MLRERMFYHGDLSGCVHDGALPDIVSSKDGTMHDASGMDWGGRSVEVSTKNLGIAAFLEGVKLPQPHEQRKSIDSTLCCGACDGYIEVDTRSDEDVYPTSVNHSSNVQIIGQLALF